MKKLLHKLLQPKILCTCLALLLISSAAAVMAKDHHKNHYKGQTFKHVATFDVMAENGSTVAEIIDTTPRGTQLVYTDSENGEIGFVDIKNPAAPMPQGTVAVGGEPTSLAILGDLVLVAVNTSESFTDPSGKLVVININSKKVVTQRELGGQPDSIAIAPDKRRAVIVLENERDEDENDGLIPQLPSGEVLIVTFKGKHPEHWFIESVDLSGIHDAVTNGADLEPEFVDINWQNEAVVSFQENNHLAIIDIVKGKVIKDFSAGSVGLYDVDTDEEDLITLDSDITKRREPDAVAWIDNNYFTTANEGDYEDGDGEEGGSRGFTVFHQNGKVKFESNSSFEHTLVAAGHYNEGRSKNKGVEPESVEFGIFGDKNHNKSLLFVGSERSNAVGVYEVGKKRTPILMQVLPTGIGPEGLKAIPQRNLFVASTETYAPEEEDGEERNPDIPTMINIYQLQKGPAPYPMIASEKKGGDTIPWVALSGLAGDPDYDDTLYAVSDSFLAKGFIYKIDVSEHPARIIDRLQVTDATSKLDLEGIAVGPDGHFWAASEGNTDDISNAILKIDPLTGMVVTEINLPDALEEKAKKNGFEGIAVTGEADSEIVYVVIQRAWPETGDENKKHTKIGRYEVETGKWSFIYYPLNEEGNGGWIGLSELALLPDGTFAVIECDKGWGESTGLIAELKAIYKVDLENAEFRAYDDEEGLVTIEKDLLADVLPEIKKRSIWTAEKLEGLAVTADGKMYCVTDNDGVDEATGETVFFRLGKIRRNFPRK